MRTKAFKKILSVVCVLALLASVCVVSFAGNASAASSYTFNNCGKVTTSNLSEGDPLPTPEVVAAGTNFLGWYNNYNFTGSPVTVAGADKTLYAKYDATVITFDDGNGVYDPNKLLADRFSLVQTPDDSTSKSLRVKYPANEAGRHNFGVMNTNAAGADGFKVEKGKTYEIYIKFKGTVNASNVDMGSYASAKAGVCTSGNKVAVTTTGGKINAGEYNSWTSINYFVKVSDSIDVDKYPYLLITFYQGEEKNSHSMDIYIDQIVISEVTSTEPQTYTLNNRGVVDTISLAPGAALPTISDRTFVCWSDASLTSAYGKAPARVTELYAKYSTDVLTFEYKGYYDPNGVVASGANSFKVAADPDDAENTTMVTDLVGKGTANSFAFAGAEGANAGLTLNKGIVYQVKFDYLAKNIDTGVGFSVKAAAADSIGTDKTNYVSHKLTVAGIEGEIDEYKVTSSSADWESVKLRFTYNGEGEKKYLALYAANLGAAASSNNVVYIDNVEIKAYTAPNFEESAEVDFENGYAWSEPDANKYTETTGNGYVSRGAIVEFGEEGNHAFNMKHYQKKNAYLYFTFNTGDHQFKLSHGGVYTISFDYFVKHSETPTELGLLRSVPTLATSGYQFTNITKIDNFEYRDDTEGQWTHVEYTYFADLSDYTDYTSLGIYLFNSTKCPEEYATDVYFDNIKVDVLTYTDDLGALVFDSTGGTSVERIALPSGSKAGVLPAPTRELYDFAGWRYDMEVDGKTITKVFDEKTIVNSGVTYLYAAWTPVDGAVEVIYRSNVPEYDAKHYSSVGRPGSPFLSIPEDPACDANTFEGWYLDRDFKVKLDPNKAPSESGYAFAKWKSEGIVIDFENYPSSITGSTGTMSDRYEILQEGANHYLHYNLSKGTNQDTNSKARTIMYDGKQKFTMVEGAEYKVTFKYKVDECKVPGTISMFACSPTNGWGNYQEQDGGFSYSEKTNGWVEGKIEFTAKFDNKVATNNNYLYIAFNGSGKVRVDDVVIMSAVNQMNVYGTLIRFVVNGGKELDPMCGDPGTALKLPTPVKPGYKFLGWYSDKEFTTPYTETVFGDSEIKLFAKWQLGKFVETFEDYPTSVKSLGVAGAYTFYTSKSSGFDASNIHNGATSLFRNGATAGNKAFTLMRSSDLALQIGSQYTLDFWVKPTSVTAADGTISMIGMSTFTGISTSSDQGVIAKAADLKEGEWQHITYTFTAKTEFIGITTTAGNDMYFDDITVTLAGYTGSSTGDSTVSPLLILAIVVFSCGALIVTGKKVFSK